MKKHDLKVGQNYIAIVWTTQASHAIKINFVPEISMILVKLVSLIAKIDSKIQMGWTINIIKKV